MLKRSKKSKKSKVFAFMLILVLCITSAGMVFAAGDPIEGSESSPAQASVTKLLKLPEGTDIPQAGFEFTVTPIEVDGLEYNSNSPNMPAIGTDGVVTISYSGSETNGTSSGGITTVSKESGNIFAGVNWPHAGFYVYEIEENSDSYTIKDANHETMAYSNAKYTLNVYVKEKTAAPGSFYVFAVGTIIDKKDSSSSGSVGDKVDSTPGGGISSTNNYSGMVFTNKYVKTNGAEDPEKPNPITESSLSVSKTVTGAFSSTSVYFDFSINVSQSAIVSGTSIYRAYVVEGSDIIGAAALADPAKNDLSTVGTDGNGNPYIEFTAGTAKSFRLKHGQKLVFINTPVGTSYNVTEASANAYTASANVLTNGTSVAIPGHGEPNTALTISNQKTGEAVNSANFINNRDEVSPAGLNINNLPFFIVILFAVCALALFIFVKSRKRTDYDR